jgi:hypothetical protein
MTCAFSRLCRSFAAVMLMAVLSAPLGAQELYVLAGGQHTQSLDETTYSYSLEYLHNLSDYAYASFTWLNEGHVTDHHRDGYSPQIWLRWPSNSRRLTLSAGVGPYRYYDTTYVTSTGAVTDAHDWGALFSVAAQWYIRAPWVLQLRYNYARTTTSISTHTLQIGVGYQFERSAAPGPVPPSSYDLSTPHAEMTLMAGNSVQNNFQSPHGVAWGAEFRERLTPYIDAIGTFLDEGDTHVVKRKGVAGQLGLVREFLDHHADVGVAGGFYFARDQDYIAPATQVLGVTTRTQVLGLLSMTATWRVTRVWHLRAYWDRTLTTNGRDTDVVLLGLGWSF